MDAPEQVKGGGGMMGDLYNKTPVAPAKAGVHHVFPRKPTGEIGPSLRWGDGVLMTGTAHD